MSSNNANKVQERVKNQPTIQNVTANDSDWLKVTLTDWSNTTDVIIQTRESNDCNLSFLANGSTYFTIKDGEKIKLHSNMFIEQDDANNGCFWLKSSSGNSTVEIMEFN